jgi:F420-non-reducing hydrogenase large subunit
VYKVDPPPAAKKLRELYNSAAFVHSHIAHFYALAGPDFVLGPDSDPAKRNILGIVEKVGIPIAGEVLKHRAIAQDIQIMVGGRSTHPREESPRELRKNSARTLLKKQNPALNFPSFR